MASRINADSSNGLQLVSDSSGEIQIQSNGVTVATINSSGLSMNSGTLAGNGPAFSAYSSSTLVIPDQVYTTLAFNVEEYDTNSCYDTSTYRFTPNVAGYYHVNLSYNVNSIANRALLSIFKNTSESIRLMDVATSQTRNLTGSSLIYLNGTTDYITPMAYVVGGCTAASNSNLESQFSAFLARAV